MFAPLPALRRVRTVWLASLLALSFGGTTRAAEPLEPLLVANQKSALKVLL